MEQLSRTMDSAPAEEEFTRYVPPLERQLFRGFTGAQSKFANGGQAA